MTPDRTRWCELLVGLERVEVLTWSATVIASS
jgi:hypothetical protein